MKKPVVLLIILAALVAFAVIYDKGLSRRVNSAKLAGADYREFVLTDLPTDQIRKIFIREGDKRVTLSLKNDKWVIAERGDYPASVDKVRRAVKLLAELKVKGKDVIDETILGDVKLLAPGEGEADRSGLLVDMQNEKGEIIASIIAGQSTSTTGGASSSSGNMFGGPGESRYVRVPNGKDGNTVWLVDDAFYELATEPKDWLEKSFVNVQKVKSAEFTTANAADAWKAERKEESAPFAFVNAPAGDELDTAKADGLTNVLASAYFDDVLTKDKATPDFMKGATKAKLTTFDGFTYETEVLEKKGEGANADAKYYLTLKVSADIPKERKAAADEKPEDKKKNDDAFAAQKKTLEEKLTKEKSAEGWVYEVSNYTVSALLKKRSDVVREKTPAPAADPEAPVPSVSPAGGGTPMLAPPPVPPTPGVISPPPAPPAAPAAPTPSPAAPAAPAKPPISVTTPPVSIDTAKPAPMPAEAAPAPAAPTAPAAPAPPAAPAAPEKPAEAKPAEPKAEAPQSSEPKPPGA